MTTTDTPSVRVDETLARFRDLQSQFDRVRDRLRKAEEQKGTVSRRTFDKVRGEYDRELDALRAKMTPLREELESHRSSVEDTLKDANSSLDVLEEELAEVMFRHKVGEYSDAEMADKRRVLEVRLDSARTRISEQRRTLEMFDAMAAADAAPAAPVAHDDEPVASVRPATPQTPRAPERTRAVVARRCRTTSTRGVPCSVRGLPTHRRRPRRPSVSPPVTPRAEAKAPKACSRTRTIGSRRWDARRSPRGARIWPRHRHPPTPARPRLGPTPARPAAAPSAKTAARTPSLVFVNGPSRRRIGAAVADHTDHRREHDNNIELLSPDVAALPRPHRSRARALCGGRLGQHDRHVGQRPAHQEGTLEQRRRGPGRLDGDRDRLRVGVRSGLTTFRRPIRSDRPAGRRAPSPGARRAP